jgi:hypothetical protein
MLAAFDLTDNKLRVWGVRTWQEIFSASAKPSPTVQTRFSADGKRVKLIYREVPRQAGGGAPLELGPRNPQAGIRFEWALDTKSPVEKPTDDAPDEPLQFFPGNGTSARYAYTPPGVVTDRRRQVGIGSDGAVRLTDSATGHELLTLTDRRGDLHAVGFSPDGRRILAAGPGGVEIFDATPRTPVVITLPVAPAPRLSPKQPRAVFPPPKPKPAEERKMGPLPKTFGVTDGPEIAPPPRPKP